MARLCWSMWWPLFSSRQTTCQYSGCRECPWDYGCNCSQSTRKGCPCFSIGWWYWETSFYWPQQYVRTLKIFETSIRQMGTPLTIGLLSQRRILMISGAAKHAWLPLRRLIPFPLQFLLQLLPLSRKISSRDQERCFPVHGVEGSQAMGLMALLYCGTGSSTRCFWGA